MENEESKINAYFMDDLYERISLFNFLDISYTGGIGYKNAYDAFGYPILIEHENENAGQSNPQSIYHQAHSAVAGDESKQGRYYRRKRIAAYENHVKPIVDKITSYTLRNPPKRNEGIQDDIERIQLDEYIEQAVCDGLRMGESWIGWDAANLGTDPDTRLPQSEVNAIDPIHKGKPYIVAIDPRRVVDFEVAEDDEDRITRVVIEEHEYIKGSLTQKAKTIIRYKEWTDTEWILYETDGKDKDQSKSTHSANAGVNIKVVDQGTHNFGQCPWFRFVPPFPIVDIAEINRAMFNISSLLDEELYNSTFTQKWITGETADNIKGTEGGTGNTLVIPSEVATVGTFGAVPGQSQALMERVNHLRDAIYMIVSMENSSTKNVAETAEKKKRDLEALYTMLVQIVKSVEEMENILLCGMEIIIKGEDGTIPEDYQTKYDRKFDVNSIEELQDEIEKLGNMPFSSPSLKRQLAIQLAQKLDQFGDHTKYTEEIEKMIVCDEAFLKGIEILKMNGMATPDILADLLGVPDNRRAEFIASVTGHGDDGDNPENERADEDGDESDDENDNPFLDNADEDEAIEE